MTCIIKKKNQSDENPPTNNMSKALTKNKTAVNPRIVKYQTDLLTQRFKFVRTNKEIPIRIFEDL